MHSSLLLTAVWLLYVPMGHGWHRLPSVSPGVLDHVPSRHAEHCTDPSRAYQPAVHCTQ